MNVLWLMVVLVPLAVLIAGWLFIGRPDLSEARTQVAAWSVIVSLVAAMGGLLAGTAAFSSYLQAQEATREHEARVAIEARFGPKIEALKRAKTVAAQLVEEDFDSTAAAVGIRNFWQFYYGDLIGVENEEVEAAMVKFGQALRAAEGGAPDRPLLRTASLDLSDAVENQVLQLEEERDREMKGL